MRNFLQNDDKLGLQIATLFGLTEQSQSEHAGGPSSDWRGYDNRDNRPKSILGWMCRRVLLDATPQHASGQDYLAKTIDYLWSRVETKAHLLSNIAQAAIRLRQPSSKLAWEVGRYASQQSCFTLTGRLRASASYCARHNTVFQGLAADGAKLALWRLWRAGYRIVNFIHDEVLVEVSENSDLHQHAESIRAHMIAGMTEVIPNVSVDVKYAASRRWYKEAEKVIDADGRLIPWEPALDPRA